jgi:hypothetical protein
MKTVNIQRGPTTFHRASSRRVARQRLSLMGTGNGGQAEHLGR